MIDYGIDRVLEPKQVLPTSAWKLDNSKDIRKSEMRINVKKIHIEGTSFRQIGLQTGMKEEKMKNTILNIVKMRGKLHNPATDTGGILYGIVEEIGTEYANAGNLKVGDEVLCNASLASIPLHLEKVISIDSAYTQADVEGYAVILGNLPVIRRPVGVPIDLFMFVLDESGTIYTVSKAVKDNKNFLVVGNNVLTNLIFGYAIRKMAGQDAQILCILDKKTELIMVGRSIDKLLSEVFTRVEYVDILKPMACVERLKLDSRFDMTVNCADILGAETINILATKIGGSVVFANIINNYNVALFITEFIAKDLHLTCADGYLEEYDEFDIEITRELAPYIEEASTSRGRIEEDLAYPLVREERGLSAKGYRDSIAENFVCESRAMMNVLNDVLNVAKFDCNVLITGETGVGKDKIANIIKNNSTRKDENFVVVNCAAISPSLMESELFGYEKGAFTGANSNGKKGFFEAANKGTIFLDEIGELPLEMQAKLLRVTQSGEFSRVGGTAIIKTDVRIISATNRDLLKSVEDKQFREDLYYRLNVVQIKVPNLAERKSEIPAFVSFFLKNYGDQFGVLKTMDEDAVEYIKDRKWKGNIRELENAVQRIIISAKEDNITLLDVIKCLSDIEMSEIGQGSNEIFEEAVDGRTDLETMVESFEKELIRRACDKFGSTRKTAAAIGISQSQLVRKKKKYGL